MIFILVNNEHVRSYQGQSEETIARLLSEEGKTFEIITQKAYEAFIEAHSPRPPQSNPEREQAIIDFKDRGKTNTERLDALIKVLEL